MPFASTGTIESGMSKLHLNMPGLIPLLVTYYSAIANCAKYGSINVALEHPVYFANADCWTPQIRWRPVWLQPSDPDREEAFGFVAIKFECPLGGSKYDAWVFMPEGSGITHDIFRVEVIADKWI